MLFSWLFVCSNRFMDIRANLLMDCLLKVLRIDDGPNFARRIGRPVRRYDLDLGLACIQSIRMDVVILTEVIAGIYKHYTFP